jgi:multidrug efflux pump subunit AcrB
MNVSAWSIRNPIPAIALFVLLTSLGTMAFLAMKVQMFMNIDLPTVSVIVSLPGAPPAQMETEVARKIESSIATLNGIKHVYTKVQTGVVIVTIEFRLETPIQEAVDNVRDVMTRIRPELPNGILNPMVSRLNMAGSPILTYAIASSRMNEEELSWFVENTLTKHILSVRGVGDVKRVGGVAREVQVEIDPLRLLALNATASDISRQLRQIHQDASGGQSNIGGAEQSVRTLATVQSAEELAKLEIVLSDGRHIRLDQVATVSDTIAERRSTALLNGKLVVCIEITRNRSAGELELADAVRQTLDKLRAEHPDITVTEAFNLVDPVAENYTGSMSLLIEGALLAVLVVWLFLRDWRATLVSASALPLSTIPTFAVMYVLGFSLNSMTLLSLSLVVGILVDDAIVEIENIMRHLRMGKEPYQAAMEAADEIGLAVIATSLTLVAVFLPTSFMGGVTGMFFFQFGWTAAIAVFFSLVVARLLIPMMSAYILKSGGDEHRAPSWLATYDKCVKWCLRHRAITSLAAVAFFLGSFALLPFLPTGFIPSDDSSQTQVHISLPPGSTFQETLAIAEEARHVVERNREVKLIYTAIGGGASGSAPYALQNAAEVRKATLSIQLRSRNERHGLTKREIEQQLIDTLTDVPGAQFKVGLGGANDKYAFVLASEDDALLADYARLVERELRSSPGLGNVTSSSSLISPELVVRPDFVRMADLGVTSSAIADMLRIATMGDYHQGLAKLNLMQRQIPIVVKLPAAARQDLGLLKSLTVLGKHGPIMLGNVASLTVVDGLAEINRYDRMRNINFEIALNGHTLGEVEKQVLASNSLTKLPHGVILASIGDAETMDELYQSFAIAMCTGVFCIYAVLVLLFRNFIQPATILVALVLSVPGAFFALFITNSELSLPSMIGLILLMGIATKNSILLIEYVIVARRDHEFDRWKALLHACHRRAQPIIMTTIAMIAGMLPTALGIGTDPRFRAPMAIAIIGGLITSTFLSLLVIPVVYTYVDDLFAAIRSRIGVKRAV